MSNDRDARIVEACLAGDGKAFRMLMDCYEKKLFNAAYRVLDDHEDAMDATQAAFVKAYENLHTFDTSRRFFSWIYRILLNESLNILKARRRFDSLSDTVPVTTKSPEERYGDEETGQRVHSALKDLKTDHRIVIVLKHYQGLSYREMSEIVGVPEKTVKSRLFSARRQLKDILLRKGYVR
jgi:RNA polymerase sigma-70 factor (ECF subfamily)